MYFTFNAPFQEKQQHLDSYHICACSFRGRYFYNIAQKMNKNMYTLTKMYFYIPLLFANKICYSLKRFCWLRRF
ncbi:MAG TPA: hypothetical protein DEP01_04760 [Aminobacterium sp.]|nr:hypothetical protein [Aminobacterium sp.]